MVFHWSLNDIKSHEVSRILLKILANISYAVVLMVSIRPFISKSSSSCINPSMTVPKAPISLCIIISFMFHIFSIPYEGTIYQPLRSGKIWHKVNF